MLNLALELDPTVYAITRVPLRAFAEAPLVGEMSMAPWHLAQVRPNADQMAKRNLERQGFLTFQPMELQTVVKRGKLTEKVRPFFTGYVFVTYPAVHAPWSVVNSTYGISRLVKFGDRPAAVPGSVIDELLCACDENGIISRRPALAVGDLVEVTQGPLTNVVGHLMRFAADQRAIILLDIIGKHTRVAINSANLRAASGRTKQSGCL